MKYFGLGNFVMDPYILYWQTLYTKVYSDKGVSVMGIILKINK